MYAFGYPQEWSAKYRSEILKYVDPLRRLSIQRTHPFWWSEIAYLTRLAPDETEYIKAARAANLPEGSCVPVFGPNAHNGYCTASFGEEPPHTDDQLITEIHAACQFAHLRFCDLILKSLPASTTLSDRDRQIVGRVVRGQSNQNVASQLALSTNTIDTYVRRCFDKLGVNDRVTAGLRGLALGLVD
ncbi:autoinducer binding domain-containing protein [Hyphomonas sp.]|uniref:helix-turn-helix transcriptional regulator n=1 Tax=Hyphomonas sp. TaxID=87 RepID=UPI0034482E64